MADEKVSLEGLWNKYALEEDEQRKKVWLDIFLCRAMEEWEFQPQRDALPSIIAPTLVSELKMEIGSSKCKFSFFFSSYFEFLHSIFDVFRSRL